MAKDTINEEVDEQLREIQEAIRDLEEVTDRVNAKVNMLSETLTSRKETEGPHE